MIPDMPEARPGATSEITPGSTELLPYPKISARGRLSASGVREWVAVEKVHGAHFAVVCDGTGVRPAKRRELLGDDALDDFFGVSRIWPALSVAAVRFAAAVRAERGDGAVVTVYGELAGGHYPHPEVPAVAGVQPVQTGVWYAPGLHWLPFDASVDQVERIDQGERVEQGGTSNGAAGARWWLCDRMLRQAAATAGLSCPPVLGQGALTVLQELPSAFPSKVPALLGLPELPDNLAEGYVLKPAGTWQETGATGAGPRPLGKVKQQAFAEDERFQGARPYLPPPQGAAGIPAWLLVQAATLLTPARAAAAVSKLGPRTPMPAVAREIADDATGELAEAVGGLSDDIRTALRQALAPGARALAAFDAEDRRAR
ncbi:hypothetical protein E6W39_04070 [Kitasatospora acidiphila]|uniref:RNA ligase domain-containing protein n=2 Tax=Kitasatospora acidiphila TaxID=2567942 RepID=A0A540VXW7_9ACTN|nr:hypothetical protein E6W39_04070 [Kitasatospora acidiphila]